jgi:hypothetical protein
MKKQGILVGNIRFNEGARNPVGALFKLADDLNDQVGVGLALG